MIKLRTIKPNPDNPRIIKDLAFDKLVVNLLKYPKFLEKRPVVHQNHIIYGGNQRFRGLQEIAKMPAADFDALCSKHELSQDLIDTWSEVRKTKSVPDTWIADINDYSEEEKKAFVIIDNIDFGEWNYDELANKWDEDQLTDWNFKMPGEQTFKEDVVSFKVKTPSGTDNDHSVFEQVMQHSNKQILVEVLNRIKEEHKYQLLEEALMHLVRLYTKS